MSEQKSFLREEVHSLLTDLFRLLTSKGYGVGCSFKWEQNTCSQPSATDGSLYSSLLGQSMSMLESTLEKEKLEPAKIILRQLFQASVVNGHSGLCAAFEATLTGDRSMGFGAGWGDIREKLDL